MRATTGIRFVVVAFAMLTIGGSVSGSAERSRLSLPKERAKPNARRHDMIVSWGEGPITLVPGTPGFEVHRLLTEPNPNEKHPDLYPLAPNDF